MPMKFRWPQICKLLRFVRKFVRRKNKKKCMFLKNQTAGCYIKW